MTDATLPIQKLSRAGLIIVTSCCVLGTLMQALDTTIANVSLPYMQGSLSASQEQINWVLTSYIVSAAIATAPTGFLASKFGKSRIFVGSILGFTAASILCGAAQSLGQVVVFRVLQGLLGAALVPVSQAIMLDIYPPEQRGFSMSLWTIGVTIGPIAGPVLGGWLTGSYSWRWAFYINVPFGIMAALGLIIFLKDKKYPSTLKMDWLGFAALGIAIGAFQTMLDRGETLDWLSSHEIVIEAVLAGVAFYIFCIQSWLAPKPFFSPKLFMDVNFVTGTVLYAIIGSILFTTLALLAPYLQNLLNYPVITAGEVLAPRGVGTMLASMICGRLVGKTGARPMILLGFALSAYASYEMTYWSPDVSMATVVIVGFVQGVSLGFTFVALTTVTFSTLPPELRNEGTGIYSLIRNMAAAIGISVTGALLVKNTQINHEIIAEVVCPFNRALQTGNAIKLWSPASIPGAAALNEEITRQASIIAYNDDFKLMMILSIIALPITLLIRTKTKQTIADDHPIALE